MPHLVGKAIEVAREEKARADLGLRECACQCVEQIVVAVVGSLLLIAAVWLPAVRFEGRFADPEWGFGLDAFAWIVASVGCLLLFFAGRIRGPALRAKVDTDVFE